MLHCTQDAQALPMPESLCACVRFSALAKAEAEPDSIADAIEADRAAVEKRSQAEDARWKLHKQKLETALRQARE
jgi:hypothetical protein